MEALHDGARKHSSKTAKQDDLPHGLAETEQASHDGDPSN
jgi:hypothetical protein